MVLMHLVSSFLLWAIFVWSCFRLRWVPPEWTFDNYCKRTYCRPGALSFTQPMASKYWRVPVLLMKMFRNNVFNSCALDRWSLKQASIHDVLNILWEAVNVWLWAGLGEQYLNINSTVFVYTKWILTIVHVFDVIRCRRRRRCWCGGCRSDGTERCYQTDGSSEDRW